MILSDKDEVWSLSDKDGVCTLVFKW